MNDAIVAAIEYGYEVRVHAITDSTLQVQLIDWRENKMLSCSAPNERLDYALTGMLESFDADAERIYSP